jgi:hypothetical protein
LYILKQYEEELSYKLLTTEEVKSGYHFKFNVASILRADQQTQINTLSTAVNSFLYTPNEARALLDLEAKEGGDNLLGNGTSIPVQYTGAQYTDIDGEGDTDPEPTPEEEPKSTPDELIKIIEAIRSGSLTYDQGVAVMRFSLGYTDAEAREILGSEDDFEVEEETIDPNGENGSEGDQGGSEGNPDDETDPEDNPDDDPEDPEDDPEEKPDEE